MSNVVLNVKGMSCGHCVKAVEGSVRELQGVNTVKVDLEQGKVTVDFQENEVSVEKIKECIDDQGYDVE